MGAKPTHAKELEIRRAVRDALALDPLASVSALCKALENKYGHTFNWQFIYRLYHKVKMEVVSEVDHSKIQKRVAELRETHRIVKEKMLLILADPAAQDKDKTSAGKVIESGEISLFNAELNAGIFAKDLGVATINIRVRPVADEIRQRILSSFDQWGISGPLARPVEMSVTNFEKQTDGSYQPEPVKPVPGFQPKPKPVRPDIPITNAMPAGWKPRTIPGPGGGTIPNPDFVE